MFQFLLTFTALSKYYQYFKDKINGIIMCIFMFQPAAYIPQLARASKEKWGISICTVDGQRFSIGDVHDKFTIQSTR